MSLELKKKAQNFGRGIGNMSRQLILDVLFDGPANVTVLVKKTGLKQPLVSQHLKILKETDLVLDKRSGQVITYELNIQTIRGFVDSLSNELNIYELFMKQKRGG